MMQIDQTKFLTPSEYARILVALRARAKESEQGWISLMVFRLAAGCGLRASEIGGLRVGSVRCDREVPFIEVMGKGRKRRAVPLTWDEKTTADIRAWKKHRITAHGASPDHPFVCALQGHYHGRPLCRRRVRERFIYAVRLALGDERADTVTVHHGRHTCATLALRGGVSLPEVKMALGHHSIAVTSLYLHVLPDDLKEQRRVFDFEEEST